MTYDMEDCLQLCIDGYWTQSAFCGITRHRSCRKIIVTPQLEPQDRGQFVGVLGASILDHPNLLFSIHPLINYVFVEKPKTETSVGSTTSNGKSAKSDGQKDFHEGALASVACSLLMKVFVGCMTSAS